MPASKPDDPKPVGLIVWLAIAAFGALAVLNVVLLRQVKALRAEQVEVSAAIAGMTQAIQPAPAEGATAASREGAPITSALPTEQVGELHSFIENRLGALEQRITQSARPSQSSPT